MKVPAVAHGSAEFETPDLDALNYPFLLQAMCEFSERLLRKLFLKFNNSFWLIAKMPLYKSITLHPNNRKD